MALEPQTVQTAADQSAPQKWNSVVRWVPAVWHGLQTGITAAFCYQLARWVGLGEGYWAGMTAIVVIQTEFDATQKLARDRIMGTAIGAITAYIGGLFGSGDHIYSFGVCVALTVLLCHLLKMESASRVAGLTVAIVLLMKTHLPLWRNAVDRFLEVSLGVVVAVSIVWLAAIIEARFPRFFAKPVESAPEKTSHTS